MVLLSQLLLTDDEPACSICFCINTGDDTLWLADIIQTHLST